MPTYSTNSALPQTPLDEWQTLAYERPKHNCSGPPAGYSIVVMGIVFRRSGPGLAKSRTEARERLALLPERLLHLCMRLRPRGRGVLSVLATQAQ